MKKQTMIMWNHLDYPTQVRAIDLISKLIEEQMDSSMRTAIAAAVSELEIWSNTPCATPAPIVSEDEFEDDDEDEDDEPEPWIH
jgi:hypothetical protein